MDTSLRSKTTLKLSDIDLLFTITEVKIIILYPFQWSYWRIIWARMTDIYLWNWGRSQTSLRLAVIDLLCKFTMVKLVGWLELISILNPSVRLVLLVEEMLSTMRTTIPCTHIRFWGSCGIWTQVDVEGCGFDVGDYNHSALVKRYQF